MLEFFKSIVLIEKLVNGFKTLLLTLDKQARNARAKEIRDLTEELTNGATTMARKEEILARLTELSNQ